MSFMPNVIRDVVSTSRDMIAVDGVVIHTIVGYWSGGKAAHWTTDASGTIRQHRDTARQSVANLDGNPRWLAIENEDHGPAYGAWNTRDGHAVPGFTAPQREAIAHILAWVHAEHDVPLNVVPDTCRGRRGVAYHRQGISGDYSTYHYGGITPDCVRFSNQEGKVCPGDRRITELINDIIPRARALAGQEVDVSGGDLIDIEIQHMNAKTPEYFGRFIRYADLVMDMYGALVNLTATMAAQGAALAALADAVRRGEASDLTEAKMRQLLDEAVASAVIDVDVHIPGVTGIGETES